MSWDVRRSMQVHIDGRCDGAVDVGYRCRAPTLLTIGETTIGSRASWNGVLTYALRWSPSGYPVALGTPSQSSRRREGYPGHVVIHGLVLNHAPSGVEAIREGAWGLLT
jgi:hypothetical protein